MGPCSGNKESRVSPPTRTSAILPCCTSRTFACPRLRRIAPIGTDPISLQIESRAFPSSAWSVSPLSQMSLNILKTCPGFIFRCQLDDGPYWPRTSSRLHMPLLRTNRRGPIAMVLPADGDLGYPQTPALPPSRTPSALPAISFPDCGRNTVTGSSSLSSRRISRPASSTTPR